jgi:phosphate transport system permease protein
MTTATPPTRPTGTADPIRRKLRRAEKRRGRARIDTAFRWFAVAAAFSSVVLLLVLLVSIAWRGAGSLNWQFLTSVPDPDATRAGIMPAMAGTVLICLVCALTAIPIGLATAILLEEYAPKRPWQRRIHQFIQLNISNLAGVPSVVYGLLGLTVFVHMFGLFGTASEPAFELGTRHYDQFVTSTGQVALAPVPSRDAPPTRADSAASLVDPEGRPIDVKIVPGLAGQLAARQQSLDALARSFLASEPGPDPLADLARAWADAGFTTDLLARRDELAPALAATMKLKGRAARKSLEEALKPAFRDEIRASIGTAIDPTATPNRITIGRDRWSYLRLPFGPSVLAGGLTLMLVILPIVIISSQEALRAVPRSLRHASLALGATQWQTVWRVTLPTATPGVMTGIILAMSRAIGEAAPILILTGIVYITFAPRNLLDQFTAMPLQIYNWASRPQEAFYDIAAAGIILLLLVLLVFNGLAVYIRHRTQKQH